MHRPNANEMIQHLSSYVRSHRKRLGLTQAELGFLVGENNQSNITRYESGKRLPSAPILLALMALFDSGAEKLFPRQLEDESLSMLAKLDELIIRLDPEDSKSIRKRDDLSAVRERLRQL